MAGKTAKKTTKTTKSSLVKFPKTFVPMKKNEKVVHVEYEFGDEKLSFDIYQTISTTQLYALAEYCVVSSMIPLGNEKVYCDQLYEMNFRLGVLQQMTNLDMTSIASEELHFLLEGEDSLYWFVDLRLEDDVKCLIRDACEIRRNTMLEKQKMESSPLFTLVKQFGAGLNQYISQPVPQLQEDMKAIYDEVNTMAKQSGDEVSEAS